METTPQGCANVPGHTDSPVLASVLVSCLFCNNILCPQDRLAFNFKDLKYVLKKGTWYGSCSRCLRLCALFERKYYTCSCDCSLLSGLLGVPLTSVFIRCLYCLGRLSFIDKLRCVENGEQFHLIRGHWRGCCNLCRPK